MNSSSSDKVYYEIDFGTVVAGETAHRTLSIQNYFNEPISFIITQSAHTNVMYQVFEISLYEFSVQAGEVYNLLVSYKPLHPHQKNVEFMTISASNGNVYDLRFKGASTGPNVISSLNPITFHTTLSKPETQKKFTLANKSKRVPAIFQFDIRDTIFKIDKMDGVIQPLKQIYITITFSPKKVGCYSRMLPLLILNQEPIMFQVFGLCTQEKTKIRLERFPLPDQDTKGVSGYLNDSYRFRSDLPLFSQSDSYLDFGQFISDCKVPTMVTNITNHLYKVVTVEWEPCDTFTISPCRSKINANSCALFEAKFCPEDRSTAFFEQVHGHVIWGENEPDTVKVPIPLNLILFGHSFYDDQGWIPDLEVIPSVIILPITLPGTGSWTTFQIKTKGRLPVLYKLIPPKHTNFIMKPMVGSIKHFQIVVVQLHTTLNTKSAFMECWNIEVNGKLLRSCIIYVKTQTDIPEVLIDKNNEIEFEPVLPGCSSFVASSIRNLSQMALKYKFICPPDLSLDITPSEGFLSPTERTDLTLRVILKKEGPIETTIKCELRGALNEDTIFGPTFQHTAIIRCKCVYSELCAVPNTYNAGNIKQNSRITTSFHLHNFGEATVHFYLSILNWDENEIKSFLFLPRYGSCAPKESVQITCRVLTRTVGQLFYRIGYYVRPNQFSDYIVKEQKPIKVYEQEHFGLRPNLKLSGIVEHNFGYPFGKRFLRDIFKFTEINNKLLNLRFGESNFVEFAMPNFEQSDKEYYVICLLQNMSDFDIQIAVEHEKSCGCKEEVVAKGLTFRQKILNCPHKDILQFWMNSEMVLANSTVLLTIKVKFSLFNKNVMSYTMVFDTVRRFQFFIIVEPITPGTISTYSLLSELNIEDMYIGLKDPPLYGFWLYNNTSKSQYFELMDKEIHKLNESEDFEIFKCLNCFGTVKPHSVKCIFFKFCPLETKLYEVFVPIRLGDRLITFKLSGTGTDKKVRQYNETLNFSSKHHPLLPYEPINMPVILSTEIIFVEPFQVWHKKECILFIKNVSRDSCFAYHWKPYSVDGLFKIEFYNEEEILKPKESHAVIISIASMGEPCVLELDIFCEVVSVTQLMRHKDSIERAKIMQDEEKNNSEDSRNSANNDFICCMPIEPEPEVLVLSVTVKIQVFSPLDRDKFLKVDYQLKQSLREHKMNSVIRQSLQEFKCSDKRVTFPIHENIKECLQIISMDVIFSEFYKKNFSWLSKQATPLYSQIKYFPYELKNMRSKSEDRECLTKDLKRKNALKIFNKPDLDMIQILLRDIVTEITFRSSF